MLISDITKLELKTGLNNKNSTVILSLCYLVILLYSVSLFNPLCLFSSRSFLVLVSILSKVAAFLDWVSSYPSFTSIVVLSVEMIPLFCWFCSSKLLICSFKFWIFESYSFFVSVISVELWPLDLSCYCCKSSKSFWSCLIFWFKALSLVSACLT